MTKRHTRNARVAILVLLVNLYSLAVQVQQFKDLMLECCSDATSSSSKPKINCDLAAKAFRIVLSFDTCAAYACLGSKVRATSRNPACLTCLSPAKLNAWKDVHSEAFFRLRFFVAAWQDWLMFCRSVRLGANGHWLRK